MGNYAAMIKLLPTLMVLGEDAAEIKLLAWLKVFVAMECPGIEALKFAVVCYINKLISVITVSLFCLSKFYKCILASAIYCIRVYNFSNFLSGGPLFHTNLFIYFLLILENLNVIQRKMNIVNHLIL